MYSIDQFSNLFGVSREAARKWALEFKSYLSDDATLADGGRKRLFDEDDLAVFALIAEMKNDGKVFSDIHKALKAGKRGIAPASPDAIIPTDKTPLAKARAEANRLMEVVRQMEADNQEQTGQNKLLREQLEKSQAEIRRLEGENAVLKYRLDDRTDRS